MLLFVIELNLLF